MWRDVLDMIGTRLEIDAPADWCARLPDGPLIIIANHPFGIADGIAILSIAERIGRPYRCLLNVDFMRCRRSKLPLPIDFDETKEACDRSQNAGEAGSSLKEGGRPCDFPLAAWQQRKTLRHSGRAAMETVYGASRSASGTTVRRYISRGRTRPFSIRQPVQPSLRLRCLCWISTSHTEPSGAIGLPVSWTEIQPRRRRFDRR